MARHRTIAVDVDEQARAARPQVAIPWYALAPLGGLAVAAAGWLLLAGPAALGWLTSPNAQLPDALGLASRLLLLAHGTPVDIGGQAVSLAPLGLSLVLIVLGVPLAQTAARGAATADDGATIQQILMRVMGLYTGTYAAVILVIAATTPTTSVPRALIGAILIGAAASYWGCAKVVGHDLRASWPGWLRAVPRAIGAALLICLGVGSALLTTTLILHRDRVAAIADGLGGELSGGLLLLIIQLAWLPNLIIWATAWSLGAGLTLGDGSLISMGITDVGFLPAIPVLGAIPPAGPVSSVTWWWLLGGIVAGVCAGLIVTMARPASRFDETTVVGALAGIATGLALVVIAWCASGGLGSMRLAQFGVRLGDLAITAPSLLGLSGLLTGLVVGLARREFTWPALKDPEATPAEEDGTQSAQDPVEDEPTLPRR